MITTTMTEMINMQEGMVSATTSVANGEFIEGKLAIDANIFGGNQLFIKDLGQLKDLVSVAQELLEVVTKMVQHG